MKTLAAAILLLAAELSLGATIDDARRALADRDYARAAAILSALELKDDDYRLYLLANARYLAGQAQQAVATLDELLRRYPKSPWRHKALFKRADALMKLGRFKEAEAVYESRVTYLASAERRGQLERVYLTHADEAFEPKAPAGREREAKLAERKPDYKAALRLYQRAAELDALPDEAPRVALRIGLCQFHLKQYPQAISTLEAMVEKHPESQHIPEALYHLGLSHARRGDPDKARAYLEKLLRDHADSPRAPDALYQIALTHGLPKPRTEADLHLGAKALRRFLELYPKHKLAPQAGYQAGLSYFNFGQFEKAIEQLAACVKVFADNKAVEVGKAAFLIGEAHRRLGHFDAAIAAWRGYLRRFPAHEDWQKAQAAIVSARFDQAVALFKKKKWDDARKSFEQFAATYPLDGRNDDALFYLGLIEYEQKRYRAAIAAWRRVVAKFPRTDRGYLAQFRIASTLDRDLHDFDPAIEEYKKIKSGPHASRAAARLAQLTEPALAVTFERSYRTDEKPRLKVLTRNIEKLHFKAYRLDPEDFFRRMAGFRDVEDLDIALIAPHQEWDAPIKNFRKYEDIDSELELPFEKPGLYAVQASAEKLQATTLVLVTDLAIIARVSKRDILLFAQNTRTGKPQPGAKLLVHDGEKIILEGTTGRDGIFQAESDNLKKPRNVAVYALAAGSPAYSGLDLRRLGVAVGLQPRGILYTDRPAYRPGEKVHYRGIIRLVAKGSYSTGEDTPVEVKAISPRGDVVHQAKVKLSRFGTLAGHFALNPREPLGTWRLVASLGEGKPTFTGRFRVDEYSLPLYRVVFDFPKFTYLRGEKIAGKLRVEYFFGQPVAGKTVRYLFARDRWHTATTDPKGEVAVEFETDFFRQTATLPLMVVMPAEGIRASRNFLLATEDFKATLSTLRDTYLVGEPFDVEVATADLEDKPIAAEVTVGLYRYVSEKPDRRPRLTPRGQTTGYVKVAEKKVTTDKTTGKAIVRFSATEGGWHLVRLEGHDSHQNLVVAQRQLFVSGEDDKIKLRILTDADTYRVGEKPTVNIVCRTGPATALLTWEGERVYRYRVVRLKKGSNRIPIEIPDVCAPNFTLWAAVAHENAFHQASKALAVLKELRVAIEPSKKELKPGEEVTLELTTTDQAGRPVAAELSLAVVDEALYARYRDTLPPLGEFFHQRRRGAFYVAAASSVFAYKAKTSEISEAILVEVELTDEFFGVDEDEEDRLVEHSKTAASRARKELAEAPPPKEDALEGRLHRAYGGRAGGYVIGGRQAGLVAERLTDLAALANLGPEAGGELLRRGQAADKGLVAGEKLALASRPATNGKTARRTALVRLREFFPQTAYWNPAITTDARGKATIKFVMPDTTSSWRLVARGITTDHLVGEATASIVTKQPFSVELATPAALTEGDKASVRASVRNFTERDLSATLELTATLEGGAKPQAARLERKVPAGKVQEEFVPLQAPAQGKLEVQARARAGHLGDAVARTIPIRPWGIPVRAGTSGRARDSFSLDLALPKPPGGLDYSTRSLEILISPSLPHDLLEACLRTHGGMGCTEQTIAVGLLAVNGIELLDRLGRAPLAERSRLEARVESAIRTLALTQRGGGWDWAVASRLARLDPFATAYALEFLRRGERKGFAVPRKLLEPARAAAKSLFAGAESPAEKAALLYGMSFHGDADFSYVNRLDRLHERLDNQSLALLALTFLNLDRRERAGQLAANLLARSKPVTLPDGRKGRYLPVARHEALWRGDQVEATALALEALERTNPRAAELEEFVNWLMHTRATTSWGSPRARAAAVRALSVYLGQAKAEAQKYVLEIAINGQKIKTLEADGMRRTVRIEAPAQLVRNRNRLDFRFKGRGEFVYTCTLEGFTRGVPRPTRSEDLAVRRRYEASPLVFEGREVPRGFSVVRGPHKTVTNPVEELPRKKTCDVTLEVYVRNRDRYLVLEDFLPAGATVVEPTISGNFDRCEVGHARITFYFSNPGRSQWLRATYRLAGSFPGNYRVLPARLYSFYRPYDLTVGEQRTLTVLAEDKQPRRAYVMSPDELFYLGKNHYEKKNYEKAWPLLHKLFHEHRLQDRPFKETARMLLYMAIERKDARAVVDYFEILKERYPELVVPFEKMLAVARAYRDQRENERAVQVFRAIAEGLYFQEGNVAGVLEDAGDFVAATDFMERLLAEYPDVPAVQTGLYSLAQKLYATIPRLATDERLKKQTTKKELLAETRGLMGRFLELYPDNPICDEVSFSLASSFLQDESYDKAIALCTACQSRYPKSPLLDSFQYIAGYSYFVTDRHARALEICRKVATGKYPTPDGSLAPSDDRYNATLMIAQVYHSLRQHEKAIAEYEKVRDRFPDARRALDYLLARELRLPEITTSTPGKEPKVELTYRNIPTCQMSVYKVDLMPSTSCAATSRTSPRSTSRASSPSSNERSPSARERTTWKRKRPSNSPRSRTRAPTSSCSRPTNSSAPAWSSSPNSGCEHRKIRKAASCG